MKLPKGKKELGELFRFGGAPEPSELRGEFWVDMLTGLPSMKWAGHRKRFLAPPEGPSGHNIFLKGWIWGRFSIKPGNCRDMGDLPAVLIDYRQPGNSFVSLPMRDYVRRLSEGLYLGRLYYEVGAKTVFLGYFSLEKI